MANVRKHDEYIQWRLAEHDKQKPSSPAEVRLKKALDALSPRSIRAWRLGPRFDPFLGTCPYPFPEVSGGSSIPPPPQRTAPQLCSPEGASVPKRAASQLCGKPEWAIVSAGKPGKRGSAEGASGSAEQPEEHKRLKMPPAEAYVPGKVFSTSIPEGQTTRRDIEARLPSNITFMDRSQQMHKAILEDPQLRIWLPRNNNIHQHVVEVVHALLSWRSSLRFKIGITVDVVYRFNTADYAYVRPHSHLRDGVLYEGMHVVYIHQTRSTIAIAEHLIINSLRNLFKSKIANKKVDMDTNGQNNDGSDDERYDAVGPHYLYIAWGEPGPCHRK